MINNIIPLFLKNFLRKKIDSFKYLHWKQNGKLIPTPLKAKQLVIKEYQILYNSQVLVESGTYMGDMVFAMKDQFKKVYSIELSVELYYRALKRFNKFSQVEILQGDSSVALKEVVKNLNEISIFWLDGHYSGGVTARGIKDCPVVEELNSIFLSKFKHVILIDDAHLFNGTNDYPSLPFLSNYLIDKKLDYELKIHNNIIILKPSLD